MPLSRIIAALLLLLTATTAQAQTEANDPPTRVGRISLVEGRVSVRTPEERDWSDARINYPISDGTGFWTEGGARAELNFGSTVLRLDGLTEATVTRLEDGAIGIRVDRGRVSLRIFPPMDNTRVAIDTPRGRFDIITPGAFRIDAGEGDRPTGIHAFEGEARFAGRDYTGVRTGEALEITGNPEIVRRMLAVRTAFDDWSQARDGALAAPQAERYVSPATPGYQDLDRAGTWQATAEYGTVWYPTAVPVGWAPYRYGHWAWVHPWGWTWIDDAPWGFAPFHYGRWVVHHGRWCWIPGPVIARPVYSPALVVFIGGPSLVIQIGGRPAPAVGWVPLGPREIYRPPYRHGPAYERNVNRHIERRGPDHHDDPRRYTNHQAATFVPQEVMRRAERVNRSAVHNGEAASIMERARVAPEPPQRQERATERSGPPARIFAPPARQQEERREATPRSEREAPTGAAPERERWRIEQERRQQQQQQQRQPQAPSRPQAAPPSQPAPQSQPAPRAAEPGVAPPAQPTPPTVAPPASPSQKPDTMPSRQRRERPEGEKRSFEGGPPPERTDLRHREPPQGGEERQQWQERRRTEQQRQQQFQTPPQAAPSQPQRAPQPQVQPQAQPQIQAQPKIQAPAAPQVPRAEPPRRPEVQREQPRSDQPRGDRGRTDCPPNTPCPPR